VACAHNTADTLTNARARSQAINAGSDCTQYNGSSKSNATEKSMCFAACQAAVIAQKHVCKVCVGMRNICVIASGY